MTAGIVLGWFGLNIVIICLLLWSSRRVGQ
jgi:hypothetical protein